MVFPSKAKQHEVQFITDLSQKKIVGLEYHAWMSFSTIMYSRRSSTSHWARMAKRIFVSFGHLALIR